MGFEVPDANSVEYWLHVETRYIQLAKGRGVLLESLTDEMVPAGFGFRYKPPVTEWPTVHLLRTDFNWRLCEVPDVFAHSKRHWCFSGNNEQTFLQAVRQLSMWQGNPTAEPTGFIKSWDGRRCSTTLPNVEPPRLPA